MYATDTILTFGLPLGRLGGARFRLSFLFPIAVIAIMLRLGRVDQGLMAAGILLFSVVLHELAHLVVARWTGGEMDEVQLWPLGGLEEPYGRGYWQDHVQTMLAGPITNLLLALSCLCRLDLDKASLLLNPFAEFPISNDVVTAICQLAFKINMTLFLVNLIPVTPFDGGVLLRTFLTSRFAEVEGRDLMVRLGLICGLLGMLTGYVLNFSTVVVVSAFVFILHLHENIRWYESIEPGPEFSEYDLSEEDPDEHSEGFGSRDSFFQNGQDEGSSHAEILDRWRADREQERRNQEQEQRRLEEEQVDLILEKLHVHGRESLSSNDLHLLNRVSNRYRDRKQHN